MERLDKRIANTGQWSRKEAKAMIKNGRVKVAGERITDGDYKCDDQAEVTVDGQSIGGGCVYLMLHKPAGFISSTEDPRERTVLELLPEHLRRIGLFPVGRLDKDTEGLLLLTNDGPLAHRLLSPKKHVDKVYFTCVDGALDQGDVAAFAQGIVLGDGTHCQPALLEILTPTSQGKVTLHEGKYHQVKRMMASRGKPVRYLKRLSMGMIVLDEGLEKGAWRPLSPQELRALLEEN